MVFAEGLDLDREALFGVLQRKLELALVPVQGYLAQKKPRPLRTLQEALW